MITKLIEILSRYTKMKALVLNSVNLYFKKLPDNQRINII